MKKGLAPIINKQTEVVILGSLPSDESIALQQYYAHPGNDFWKLMSDVVGKDIYNADYATRIKVLKQKRIGLWDIIDVAHSYMHDLLLTKNTTHSLLMLCIEK